MGQKSSLVIIGNEILSGRTQDKNTSWIGDKMATHGVPLAEVRVVPDIEDKVVEAVNAMRAEYDYVFTTGGIGPTHDDITASCIAKAFGLEFGRHEDAYAALLEYYGPEELTDARATMANMPVGASLIPNPVSGAPGFRVENVFVMAGVPRIMQAMLEFVITQIAGGEPVLANSISCNLQESVISQGLGVVQDRYAQVDIGSYPSFRGGKLTVSVVLRSVEEVPLKAATADVLALISECGGAVQSEVFQVPLG